MNASVPQDVRTMAAAKCADCHSDATRAPIYGRFAPMSWLMERDIVEGRKAMNLSAWDSYSDEQKQTLMAKMVQETKTRKMPLVQYRLIHWGARVSDADVQALTQWTKQGGTLDNGSGLRAGDAAAGKAVFERRCTGCHAMEADREGPRLQGVVGRRAGAVAGFVYSPALLKANVVWDDTSLERWLTDPDEFVPGNNMEFHLAKAQERRDVIQYLKEAGK